MYSPEREDVYESSLERFEAYVKEKEYSGFIAQAKILRSKLLQKQGEFEKAQSLVKEVMRIAESSNMNYLKRMIAIYVPEFVR